MSSSSTATSTRASSCSRHVTRLYDILERLFAQQVSAPEGTNVGINLQVLARALHSIRPKRFPESAEFSGTTNALLNWESFGLTQ